jgi:hypothetical protein
MSFPQYNDLLPEYPSQDDPEFQRKIASLYEFAELKTGKTEVPPKRGDFYKHQLFAQRFMQHYDRLFAMHDTGTGKSCLLFAITEYFRRQRLRDPTGSVGAPIGAVIITLNLTLIRELKSQLLCVCSNPGDFDSDSRDGTPQPASSATGPTKKLKRSRRAGASINVKLRDAKYEFITYGSFASKVWKAIASGQEAEFRASYSRHVFFFDEFPTQVPSGKLFTTSLTEVINMVTKPAPSISVKSADDKKGKHRKKREVYKLIWYAAQTIPGIKKIISTGTPAINDPREFAMALNPLLPPDKQMPVDENFYSNLDPNNAQVIKQFQPYFNGLISYVRALDTGVDVVQMGDSISDIIMVDGKEIETKTQVKVFTLTDQKEFIIPMQGAQAEAYGKIIASQADAKASKAAESLDTDKISASAFVFPAKDVKDVKEAPAYGERGFDRWFKTVYETTKRGKKESRTVHYIPDPEFIKLLRPIDGSNVGDLRTCPKITGPIWPFTVADPSRLPPVAQYSLKFFTIAEIERRAVCYGANYNGSDDPQFKNVTGGFGPGKPGNSFVFCREVRGSGSLSLAAVLQAYGFQEYDGKVPMFSIQSRSGSCGSPHKITAGSSIFLKKPRYCLFTGVTTGTRADEQLNMIAARNAPENQYGEYLQIFIVSDIGGIGINLTNGVRVYGVGGEWNPAREHQAISRNIRATSHIALIAERLEQLKSMGIDIPKEEIEYKELRQKLINSGVKVGEPIESEITDLIPEAVRGASLAPVASRMALANPVPSTSTAADLQRYKLLEKHLKVARVRIEIYRLRVPFLRGDNETVSVDDTHYLLSEDKDRKIRKLLRIAKMFAVDGLINSERNVRQDDIDGSAICDYTSCKINYVNRAPEPSEISYDNYVLLYSSGAINQIKRRIREIFNSALLTRFAIAISELSQLVKPYLDDRIFIMALDALFLDVNGGNPIRNRYGFHNYLNVQGDYIYLTNSAPSDSFGRVVPRYDTHIYTSNILGVIEENLSAIINENTIAAAEQVITSMQYNPQAFDIKSIMENEDIKQQALYVEWALTHYRPTLCNNYHPHYVPNSGVPAWVVDLIEHKMGPYIFCMNEPVTEIQERAAKIAGRQGGRGRPRKSDKKEQPTAISRPEALSIELKDDPNGSRIFIHILLNLPQSNTKYNAISRTFSPEGPMRILKSDAKEWDNTKHEETYVYNRLIQIISEKMIASLNRFNFNGVFDSQTGNFHIVDLEMGADTKDKRSQSRGRVCGTVDKIKLVNYAFASAVTIPVDQQQTYQNLLAMNHQELVGRFREIRINNSNPLGTIHQDALKLMEGYPKDRLAYYLTLWPLSKKILCNLLYQKLSETNQLLIR